MHALAYLKPTEKNEVTVGGVETFSEGQKWIIKWLIKTFLQN